MARIATARPMPAAAFCPSVAVSEDKISELELMLLKSVLVSFGPDLAHVWVMRITLDT